MKNVLWFFNYISWLCKYLRLVLGFNVLRDIKILSIEFTSICNLLCKYCSLEKLDRPEHLDINIYEKLIKEVCENQRYNIKVLEWPISGEFFIYPDYERVIEITRKYMDTYPNFRPFVILNDNLILMNEKKIDLILKSKVVKQIICSIDGHDAQTYEDMRSPAKFGVVLRNTRLLIKKNEEFGHPVFIQVHNGRDEKSFGKELSKEMKEIFDAADDVSFWTPKHWNESFTIDLCFTNGTKEVPGLSFARARTGNNWSSFSNGTAKHNHKGCSISKEKTDKEDKRFFPAKGFCSFVFNSVALASSGKISKCCMDLKGSSEYGDFTKDSLENIWYSRTRREFLTSMLKNKRNRLKGCCTCAIAYANNDNRYINFFKIIKRKLYPFIYGKGYRLRPIVEKH